MKKKELSRREFLKTSLGIAAGTMSMSILGCSGEGSGLPFPIVEETKTDVVSVVKIRGDQIGMAVEEAIDLLGGIEEVTRGKQRIMLKPNLVGESAVYTTKPAVIKSLAGLMLNAGKEVLIGEGSATGTGFNLINGKTYWTKDREILDAMQHYIFDTLGYTELASSLGVPLINLHSGEMVTVDVPDSFIFDKITLNRLLADIDMLCSVPMMKTHVLAQVTLGIKNLMGVYPGMVYGSMRSQIHDVTVAREPAGTAPAIIDVVRANKVGLVVIDGSMAMEGNGPTNGSLVKMDLIIAGTNPLATDMVAAAIMGFAPTEIPTFSWAQLAGMRPKRLGQIEVRGEKLSSVARQFVRPQTSTWTKGSVTELP